MLQFLKDDLPRNRITRLDAFRDLASQGLAALLHLGVQPQGLPNDIDLIGTPPASNFTGRFPNPPASISPWSRRGSSVGGIRRTGWLPNRGRQCPAHVAGQDTGLPVAWKGMVTRWPQCAIGTPNKTVRFPTCVPAGHVRQRTDRPKAMLNASMLAVRQSRFGG